MQVWDGLINAICRPYRISYKTSELLGGVNGCATISRTKIRRQDFVITNKKDQRLQCSFWEPHDPAVATKKLPAVIYCHCNSGSRLDAAEAIGIVLPMGVRVFSLDFSGSGISEGEYVTLGANEVEDLSCLVDFIRAGGHTTTLALWGRSMGAVTALLYSERDPSVAGLVLDSPFSKLTDLMRELAQEQRIPLWSMVGGTALKLMRRSVRKRAGFDINSITPVDMVPRSYVPAFFGHAKEDTFVRPHHSERLHGAYAGDKEIMLFDHCDHNSPRPLDFYAASASFLARALHVDFDMQMLPSMMSDTSMLMPNETGQTHSIMPFGNLPFDSAHIPREADEEDGSTRDLNGGVDMELQQALELSLQSCAISESARPPPPSRSSSGRQSNRSGGGVLREQPFGWGSPDQKIPACTAVGTTEEVARRGSEAELSATGSVASRGSEAGASATKSQCSSTGLSAGEVSRAVAQKEPSGSSAAAGSRAAGARRRVFDTAQQDTGGPTPAGPQAHRTSASQQPGTRSSQSTTTQPSRHAFQQAPAADHARRAVPPMPGQASASGSTAVQSRSSGASSAQASLASHPIGSNAKATPLARSPAVSPAKRHAVLPHELSKSTKSSVWNLFPSAVEK